MREIDFAHLFSAKKLSGLLALVLLAGCTAAPPSPTLPTVPTRAEPSLTTAAPLPAGTAVPSSGPAEATLSEDEIATLSSLEQLDGHPLYTLHYRGAYTIPVQPAGSQTQASRADREVWACSLFAALGDPGKMLFGRNFDWRPSPAVLLFTDPPDGYASVAMVDIEYLGYSGSRAKQLLDLPLSERVGLLDAPSLPFDGMNEKGLAVGMAAVPAGDMRPDPAKGTIDELAVIRMILDHAATVDEAVDILGHYNIDFGEVPIHYLIASGNGDSALVEFSRGEMAVFRGNGDWQAATNFLFAETAETARGQDTRYNRLSQGLAETGGKLAVPGALDLLADVAQSSGSATQWSVVYDLSGGGVHVVLDRKYGGKLHNLQLNMQKP